jgi:ATP-dependent protease HslVU (ClpYQ) peptidase subunit
MTMCMGFSCRNGLVVAADTQQTFQDSHTFHENKIHSLKWKNGRAIWGFSGEVNTSKIVWENLEKHFTLERIINRTEIKDIVKETLTEVLREEEVFLMLLGGWTEGEQKVLLQSNGTDVMYADRCEVIGSGDSSLSRFWRDIYLKALPNPNVWQASIAAIYFIMQAKKYNGQFVGGGTEILLMHESPINHMRLFAPEHSEVWERRLESIEHEIIRFLTSITHADGVTDAVEARRRFESATESFAEEIRAMNKTLD